MIELANTRPVKPPKVNIERNLVDQMKETRNKATKCTTKVFFLC